MKELPNWNWLNKFSYGRMTEYYVVIKYHVLGRIVNNTERFTKKHSQSLSAT